MRFTIHLRVSVRVRMTVLLLYLINCLQRTTQNVAFTFSSGLRDLICKRNLCEHVDCIYHRRGNKNVVFMQVHAHLLQSPLQDKRKYVILGTTHCRPHIKATEQKTNKTDKPFHFCLFIS